MARPTLQLMGADARKAIITGVRAVCIPVAKTFGPQGRNALLFRTFNRGSRITNDGYTVAECQIPKNIFVRLVAEVVKESCKKTNEKVGDGTTGTALILWKLMEEVYALLSEKGSNMTAKQSSGKIGVMTLKSKILESATKVKEMIRESAKKVETLQELEKIARVSVEDPELGKVVAGMAWEVGVDGFIDVVEGYKGEVETEEIKGFRFAAKVADKAFVNNKAKYEMVAMDCAVLITNYALDNAGELGPIYSRLNQAGVSKIITIAPSFSNNVLVNMAKATTDGYFQYPVAVPSLRKEQFEDLAIYCGAKFIDKGEGTMLRNVQPADLGFLEKLIVKDSETKEDAIATGGKGTREVVVEEWKEEENKSKGPKKIQVRRERTTTAIADRIELLKGQLTETRQEMFKKLMERRIASMSSAIGIIRVGDTTDASALYRKLKIEDGVYACRAALRTGYVKGGGICLKEIAEKLPEDDILKKVLEAPYNQIQNSVEGGVAISKDIIDPADAIYYSVEHATSIAANLATVETITPEMEDPIHGEGEMAIAQALREKTLADKKHWGELKENEEEEWKDGMIQNFGTENMEEVELMDRG